MKNRPWKLAGAIVLVAALGVLLAFTIHLMRSTSTANRELDALRSEVTERQAETATRQSELLTPLADRVNELSQSLKEQEDALIDLEELGTRVAKLEAGQEPISHIEAEPAPQPGEEKAAPAVENGTAIREGSLSTEAASQGAVPVALGPEVSSSPASATPAAGERVDEGRFLILQTGVVVGVEEFVLFRSGDGYTQASRTRRSEGVRGIELVQTVSLAADWRPTGYEFTGTVDGVAEDIRATILDDSLSLIASGEERIEQKLQTEPVMATFGWAAPSSLAVLHRALGAKAADAAVGAQALRADVPEVMQVVVGARIPVTLSAGRSEDLGYRHEIRWGDETRPASYVVQNDVVVAVEIPRFGLFAYRQDLFPNGLIVTRRTLLEMAAPLGIIEFDMPITNQGTTLHGTFTIPSSAVEKMSAVLLLPDLGAYDRNGDAVGLQTRLLRDLALRLGQQGVATYRIDPRGIGESGGDFPTLTLQELETDALIALISLRASPRVDPASVYVVGFGYGGLIAQRLGARGLASGAISIATPARSMAENAVSLVRRRAEADGASASDVQTLVEREEAFWRFVRSTQGTWADVGLAAARASLPWMTEVEYMARSQSLPLPLLRDVADMSPVEAVAALHKKTLLIQGDKDSVVPPTDAGTLAQAASEAGNEEASAQVLSGLNHWLRNQPEPGASLDGRLDTETSWDAISAILTWISPEPPVPPGGSSGPNPAS